MVEKYLGQKKFVWEISWEKQKFFGQKDLGLQYLFPENIGDFFLYSKQFLVEKILWSKEYFGKKILDEKNFWPKKFSVKKF